MTHTGTHTKYCVLIHSSSPFTEDHLVFMTQRISAVLAICLRQPPRSSITGCGVPNPNDLLHMHLRLRVVLFSGVVFCRRGVSLRAAPLPTTLPFWCRCPVTPTHPGSRPAQAAPSGCLKRAQCSGISSLSLLVSNAKSLTGFRYLCVLTGGFMLICVFTL